MLIDAGDRFFKRHGGKAVFLARWIALVRFAAAWLAGINQMPFKEFFFWNALGGITWGLTFGLVGYFGGHAAANVLTKVGDRRRVMLAVAGDRRLWLLRCRERRAEPRGDARGRPPRQLSALLGVEAQRAAS